MTCRSTIDATCGDGDEYAYPAPGSVQSGVRIDELSRSRMFCPGTGFIGTALPFTTPTGDPPSPLYPAVMQSSCPSVMSALRGSSSGNASGRYFSVNTLVSSPSGILSWNSCSMMPQAMLV